MNLKNTLKAFAPNFLLQAYRFVKHTYFPQRTFSTPSYSQNGEDILLNSLFCKEQNGFYVDVGAHHPFRFSNTYILYKRGWKGINIDAMPGSMRTFEKFRKRDINIECGVGSANTQGVNVENANKGGGIRILCI